MRSWDHDKRKLLESLVLFDKLPRRDRLSIGSKGVEVTTVDLPAGVNRSQKIACSSHI